MTTFFRGYHTQAADTIITEIMPPLADSIPRVLKLVYENAGTEHTLTFMRTVGSTTTTEASDSTGTTLTLSTIKPGKDTANAAEDLAANDFVAWNDDTGVFRTAKITGVSGNQITVGTLNFDVAEGANVYAFYEVGRVTHQQVKLPVNVTTTIETVVQGGFSVQKGVQTSKTGVNEPLLIHIDNATAAGKLHYVSGSYAGSDNLQF